MEIVANIAGDEALSLALAVGGFMTFPSTLDPWRMRVYENLMKTYQGGCHCGKVRYEVTMDLGPVLACNCSICGKKAYLLGFVPAEQFKLLSGSDDLTDYQFNKHNVHHLFCATCGIQSFSHGKRADGTPMYSINVRCLDDVDVSSLEVKHVDGRSR